MELTNFAVDGQYIGLEWPKGHADLHNNFNFVRLEYQLHPRVGLVLEWTKSAGSWARKEPYQKLRLVFEGVRYLKIRERDPEYPFSEDDTVAQISRTPPEARDEFENMYFNEDAQPHYDLTIGFQSEWGIKVNADTVRLELES
ncbi:hypothetical protein [Hymenobacter terrestris]|uniref:Uncharacterized protein n=1 Tax=Hymenobacter terrestris TaxID=2748310 RepID=A0ABX2Q658_9BACT|nr:hypothetical protein [Hymenobacter terrestris]NVO85901.1 hypothetical protein [Hymenobacter terrestris]